MSRKFNPSNSKGITEHKPTHTWGQLLEEAVKTPGLISTAYSQFHNYSLGNQMLALLQCQMRGLTPGPINTFNGWKRLGRYVQRGQKALILCMPITIKKKDGEEDEYFKLFVYKANWFVMSQTEGDPLPEIPTPTWDKAQALSSLGIQQVEFDELNGNIMGYAQGKDRVAINPVNPMPHKTLFHELAHILLGHTTEGVMSDGEHTPRDIREVEAEATAMLVCDALGLPGAEYSRGYIQNWNKGENISDKSAVKIFAAADKILKAGRPSTTEAEGEE